MTRNCNPLHIRIYIYIYIYSSRLVSEKNVAQFFGYSELIALPRKNCSRDIRQASIHRHKKKRPRIPNVRQQAIVDELQHGFTGVVLVMLCCCTIFFHGSNA